jgi:hypothetical protein
MRVLYAHIDFQYVLSRMSYIFLTIFSQRDMLRTISWTEALDGCLTAFNSSGNHDLKNIYIKIFILSLTLTEAKGDPDGP